MKELYIQPLTELSHISERWAFLTESNNISADAEGFINEYNEW